MTYFIVAFALVVPILIFEIGYRWRRVPKSWSTGRHYVVCSNACGKCKECSHVRGMFNWTCTYCRRNK